MATETTRLDTLRVLARQAQQEADALFQEQLEKKPKGQRAADEWWRNGGADLMNLAHKLNLDLGRAAAIADAGKLPEPCPTCGQNR